MYTQDGVAICSAIVTDEGNGICEIKSLAVAPEFQRKGYGKEMSDFLSQHYADKFSLMTVGTGDSMSTISFYRKCGFHYSHTVPDFFTVNYDHPIEEDGKILEDMLYFRKYLTVPQAICKNACTEELILSLLNLWKESVKASHHFLTESDIHDLIPAGSTPGFWRGVLLSYCFNPFAAICGTGSRRIRVPQRKQNAQLYHFYAPLQPFVAAIQCVLGHPPQRT